MRICYIYYGINTLFHILALFLSFTVIRFSPAPVASDNPSFTVIRFSPAPVASDRSFFHRHTLLTSASGECRSFFHRSSLSFGDSIEILLRCETQYLYTKKLNAHLLKKSHAIYGTQKSIIVFTKDRHRTLF
jgi:hypothetical protein